MASEAERLLELFDRLGKEKFNFRNINDLKKFFKRSLSMGLVAGSLFLGRKKPRFDIKNPQESFNKINELLEKRLKEIFKIIPKKRRPKGAKDVYKWLKKQEWTTRQLEGIDMFILSMLYEFKNKKLSKMLEVLSKGIDALFEKKTYSVKKIKPAKAMLLFAVYLSVILGFTLGLGMAVPGLTYEGTAIIGAFISGFIGGFSSHDMAREIKTKLKLDLNKSSIKKTLKELFEKISELFGIALFFWDKRKDAITKQLKDYPLKEQFEKDLNVVLDELIKYF